MPMSTSELSDGSGPVIIVDFDDVINVRQLSEQRMRGLCAQQGWRRHEVRLDGGPEMIFYHPRAGTLLRDLARRTGSELAWGTLRGEYANRVSPLLGLPDLPVAPTRPWEMKAPVIIPWVNGRPFVWFEDRADECDLADELAGDQPHKMIKVDPRTGLTAENMREAYRWLWEVPGASRAAREGGSGE